MEHLIETTLEITSTHEYGTFDTKTSLEITSTHEYGTSDMQTTLKTTIAKAL